MREDYLFADQLNQILIWYTVNGAPNDGTMLYTFDGSNLTYIPNPNNNLISGIYGVPFENDIILSYIEFVEDFDLVFYLYKYDGTNLVEVSGMPSTIFHHLDIFNGENKLYIALNNYNFTSSLNVFDGNSISEILNSPFYIPHYITEFGGKAMFSLANTDLNSTGLYAFDGTSFDEISGAESDGPIKFSGIINNKLYLRYINNSSSIARLYSLNPDDSEVQPVPNTPQGLSHSEYLLKTNNLLVHKFFANHEISLYAHDQNDQFWSLDPENHLLENFAFQLGDNIYASYYDNDWDSRLFVWDSTLNTPDFSATLNDIVVYPNPASDILFVDIPKEITSKNIELTLYSIDGKLVSQQYVENNNSQQQLSLENLNSGIYILKLKGENTIIRKKIIKK